MLINKYFKDQDTAKGTELFGRLINKVAENSDVTNKNETPMQPEKVKN